VRGARAKSALSRSLGAKLRVGLDSTLIGALASFRPKLSGERTNRESSSFGGLLDFVFIFRLRKVIVYYSGEITHIKYTKRAIYNSDGRLTKL
jgi:hypothetical protein